MTRPAPIAEARSGPTHAVAGVAAMVATAVAGVMAPSPAAADPPQPTDYRSVVESVEPATPGVEVAVVGGDAFLEIRVDDGHEVIVNGYNDEPYLRFLDDGTVERNRNSPTTYINEDRLGDVTPPASADAGAEPDWEVVATGGTYAWHDHTIHFMGSGRPPGKSAGDVVDEWSVDITVDGTPTVVSGRLTWLETVSPLPWAVLGLLAAAVVVVAARRSARLAGPAAAGAAVVAAAAALVMGWSQYADAPAGSGASPIPVVVPAVGVVAGIAGLAARRRWPTAATAGSLAAVAATAGWAALRLEVLWMPVLPTGLPENLDRAGTAVALGLAVAAAGTLVLAGVPRRVQGSPGGEAHPADR